METKTEIHTTVAEYKRAKEAAERAGQRFQASARKKAVLFVDMASSVAMKQGLQPEDWAEKLMTFLEAVSKHAEAVGGEVIKCIGDEVMVTFDAVAKAETFIGALVTDKELGKKCRFRVAADYGDVFDFSFSHSRVHDPYGVAVDRAARLAKFADVDATLCGRSYVAEVSGRDSYLPLGKFSLKGFPEPEEIFLRKQDNKIGTEYYQPLIKSLKETAVSGYRYVSRTFEPDYFSKCTSHVARPFGLRELLNVPKLPYSFKEFYAHIESFENKEEICQYCGFLVEWQGRFRDRSVDRFVDCIYLTAGLHEYEPPSVMMVLPMQMLEAAKEFHKGQEITFRGILVKVGRYDCQLNYVDLALPIV